MTYPSRDQVQKIKDSYPKGTKVCLDFMVELHAPPEGTIGTVWFVDDMGQIHVNWSTGSSLALCPDTDEFHVV